MSTPILSVHGLTRRYAAAGGVVAAVRDISFEVCGGDTVAVIGPSGSGKTTLLNLLAGLDQPTSGQVLFEGRDLATLRGDAAADFRRRHVGFVFQFFNLIPTMTAADNVAVPLLAEGLGRREREARVERALESVGLGGRGTRPASQLSGGEMQRVAIARALIMSPRLVLADEPTGNLDSVNGKAILDLLQQHVRSGDCALVLVTHSYRAAVGADRILVMRDGMVDEEVGPEDLGPRLQVVPSSRRRSER